MSRNMNNFTLLPGLRRTDSSTYGAPHHTSNNPHEFNEVPVFYRYHHSTRENDERSTGAQDPLQLWEVRRTPTEHHRIPNFPVQPHRMQQTYNHNEDMRRRGFNPTRHLAIDHQRQSMSKHVRYHCHDVRTNIEKQKSQYIIIFKVQRVYLSMILLSFYVFH